MERVRRLAQLWSWLPAFRAVAELEHLPSAAEEYHVSASALSRSVKMLEDQIGVELFERQGRRIILNDAGHELLKVVRQTMRELDDGIATITSQVLVGRLRISAPGPFASLYVLPVIEALSTGHPRLVPELTSMSATAANLALRAGQIDLALVDDPVADESLIIERLVDVSYGVYCGRSHPLFKVEKPKVEDLAEHRFAVPPEGDDHWPPDLPRKIGFVLGQLQLGIELCSSGACLAVLPDPIATASPRAADLRRLPFDFFRPAALYAVYRQPLGFRNKTEIALEKMRELVRAR